MSDFRLKIQIGNADIELQGEGELVHKIFSELREDGLGALSISAKIQTNPYQDNMNDTVSTEEENGSLKGQVENFPAIEDIILKNMPKTEVEWILIYAFYASNFASQPVSRKNIKDMYNTTKRLTETRSKNFASNIQSLASNNFINAVNADDYIITETGKKKVLDILSNKQSEKPKQNNAGGKRKINVPTNYQLVELGLESTKRQELNDFYFEIKPKNKTDQIILLFYWMNKNNNMRAIDTNIAYSLLKTVQETTTFNIKQCLINAKSQANYLKPSGEKGKYELTHIGEDYVEHSLLKK